MEIDRDLWLGWSFEIDMCLDLSCDEVGFRLLAPFVELGA